ncbi:hypothetical protein A8B82_18225 [Sulfitobacter sp. EhC04]|uniref:CpsD/CapB family tyrosine-protein kinase n=1 Tax=Sulfitobacter sp. EhC04 TaxID=1849168 RepID=UPI0007F4A8CB|nr:CpsD/CapB family tyrosine-protein kinase [Sulfitobacter sp. EhC04]OAN74383.1 hypothetical protein A8B82_18225 [Sulfitobacter sp. EhC04]
MKDNLLRADPTAQGTEDESWSQTSGLRHSIRPRRHLPDDLMADAPVDMLDVLRSKPPVQTAPEAPETIAEPTMQTPAQPAPVQPASALSAPALTSAVDAAAHQTPGADVAGRNVPHWDDLDLVTPGDRRNRATAIPVVDAARDSLAVQAFDLLRTRLRKTTGENGWVNIAITAPTRGCGTTFTALNLALSLSRIAGSRTVLMDFNLRDPGLAPALDVAAPGEMRDFLSGDARIEDQIQRVSDTLALGLNAAPDMDAAETLQNPALSRTLDQMRAALRPDLVIYDMPPMLGHDDVSAFLPHLDGILLVSDGSQTMGKQLVECEHMLDGQVPLLGVVLNRARSNSLPRYK